MCRSTPGEFFKGKGFAVERNLIKGFLCLITSSLYNGYLSLQGLEVSFVICVES